MTNRFTSDFMLAIYFTAISFVFLGFLVMANMQLILQQILMNIMVVGFGAAMLMIWRVMPDEKEKKVN